MRWLCALLLLLPVAAPADAAELKPVAMGNIQAWCETRTLSQADALNDDVVDATKEAAAKDIDAAMQTAAINYGGFPFVQSAQRVSTPAAPGAPDPTPTPASAPAPAPIETFVIEVCVPVSPAVTQAPPATLSARTLPATAYSALPCGEMDEDACVTALKTIMVDTFGADKRAAIFESPILVSRSVTSLAPADIAATFRAGAERATYHALTVSGTGTSGTDLTAKIERPLLLDSKAALVVEGAPVAGALVLAIRSPQ